MDSRPKGASVSHPIPLHPDADLAVVLDDMRQSVAAWGDEGMVMRFFRASICVALLSILDTLIELLADFRAGRLPPVLPAHDEYESAAEGAAASPRGRASCQSREPGNRSVTAAGNACADAPGDAPDQCADQSTDHNAEPALRRWRAVPPPPRLTILHPDSAPREIAWSRSRVPRWPSPEFEGRAAALTRVHFVA
jgi:hypothetical protein